MVEESLFPVSTDDFIVGIDIGILLLLVGKSNGKRQASAFSTGLDSLLSFSLLYGMSESSSNQSGLIRGNLRRIFCNKSYPGLLRPDTRCETAEG